MKCTIDNGYCDGSSRYCRILKLQFPSSFNRTCPRCRK